MATKKTPVNIELLSNDRKVVANLSPITDPSFYSGSSRTFNPKGLFSTEIFGSVMEPRRQRSFAYIDLNTKILHPVLYRNMEKVAKFYTEVITGKSHAVWDDKAKTFIKSNELDGETGYSFFLKHFKDIVFERNDSLRRNARIDVLDKYRSTGTYDFLLVMPPGLREVEEGSDGNIKVDEINDFYRSIIGHASNIDKLDVNNPYNDNTKSLIQRNFNAIYDLLFSYLKGKTGVIQAKFFKRKLEHGTRSILTAAEMQVSELYGPQKQSIDEAALGLYQTLKGALPLATFAIKTHPLVLGGINEDLTAQGINPKTLLVESVNITAKERDSFTTDTGINGLINRMAKRRYRKRPVTVNGNYLAMVYKDEANGTFRIVTDPITIDEARRKLLVPMNYMEFLYYITAPKLHGLPVWVTRYPSTGDESCTPNWTYLKTSTAGLALKELDDNDQIIEVGGDGYIYREWPSNTHEYMDTIAVHPNKLLGYGGDHDGISN
jgi:hypothetical protein